jgi:endonuclease/exonuclease/phosphatase family metal-dependent hydrolase
VVPTYSIPGPEQMESSVDRNGTAPEGAEPRSALAGRVRIEDQELLFVGIHLYRTEQERLAQARELVGLFEGSALPVILAGDFNSTPDSSVISLLNSHRQRAEKQGVPLTFPSDQPDREIDFIFYPGESVEVLQHRVIEEARISDHRPLLLDFRFTTNQ